MAASIDSAGAPWPKGAINCPADFGGVVSASFWAPPHDRITVTVDTSGCDGGSNAWANRIDVFDGPVAAQLRALVGPSVDP